MTRNFLQEREGDGKEKSIKLCVPLFKCLKSLTECKHEDTGALCFRICNTMLTTGPAEGL